MVDDNQNQSAVDRVVQSAREITKKVTSEGKWKPSDVASLEKKIDQLYSDVQDKLIKYGKVEELQEIRKTIDVTTDELSKYKTDNQHSHLYNALKLIRSASIDMEKYSKTHPIKKDMYYLYLTAFLFYNIFFGWVIHLICLFFLPSWVFYVDLFFISAVGAFASSILYLGAQGKPITQGELIAKLVVSPIVAVVLVVILSGLNIGLETEAIQGVTTQVGTLTLIGQSEGIKMAFGFIFAFFGETSIEILRGFIKT